MHFFRHTYLSYFEITPPLNSSISDQVLALFEKLSKIFDLSMNSIKKSIAFKNGIGLRTNHLRRSGLYFLGETPCTSRSSGLAWKSQPQRKRLAFWGTGRVRHLHPVYCTGWAAAVRRYEADSLKCSIIPYSATTGFCIFAALHFTNTFQNCPIHDIHLARFPTC